MLSKYEDTCEIIAGPYYSNCIIEAIRAKFKKFTSKIYFCPPYKKKTGRLASAHALWEDENYSYDFSDIDWSDNGHWWQYIWYKGYVRRWPKTFAKDYYQFRKNRLEE